MLATEVRRDARSGDADAQFKLGCMYHDGYGVLQDYLEAAKWYRLAGEQGHAGGQFNLGLMHWLGGRCSARLREAPHRRRST